LLNIPENAISGGSVEMVLYKPRIMAPTTIWSMLDYFLLDLASQGDKVCRATTLSRPFYKSLTEVVCGDREEAVEEVMEAIRWKPYYPFILLSYYVLMHRQNLAVASKIYNKLREAYEKYPYSFDGEEECALKVLGVVVDEFTVLSRQPRSTYEGRLHSRLREIAYRVEKIGCPVRGWGRLFKALLLSHLIPEESKRYLDKVLREKPPSKEFVEEDIAEAYNILEDYGTQVVHIFLKEMARSVKEVMESAFKELDKLKEVKEKKEKKLNSIERFIVFKEAIKDIYEVILTMLSLLLGGIVSFHLIPPWSFKIIIPIVLAVFALLTAIPRIAAFIVKRSLDKTTELINNFVENYILKDLHYKIIWPSGG